MLLALASLSCTTSDEHPFLGPTVIPDAGERVCPKNSMNPGCLQPKDDGCGTAESCGVDGTDFVAGPGNDVDDDCNGLVDEGCDCAPGASKACFAGPPGRRHVGVCADGTQTCEASSRDDGGPDVAHWGPCEGGITPSDNEGALADRADNDCNGCTDEGLCEEPSLSCPNADDQRIPGGEPFREYTLDAFEFYPGGASSRKWTVEGGPCDAVLGQPSFTLTDARGTESADGFTIESTIAKFTPILSGDYRATLELELAPGDPPHSCSFLIHIAESGLRVELCWDTTGQSDLDLHLHRESSEDWFSADDCYYENCRDADVGWGYPATECAEGPQCPNPRLDLDNVGTPGKPENINLDNPHEGDKFRVMVAYYSGNVVSHPMINLYCDGSRLATYGAIPDQVPDFVDEDLWRVADITWGGGGAACWIEALQDSAGGYDLGTEADPSF